MAAKGKGPDVDTYKKLFKEADKNGDGFLTIQELRDLLQCGGSKMTDSQIADTFVFFDGPSGDKRVTFEEFCNGLNQIIVFVEKLKDLFDATDADGSGALTAEELKTLLERSGQKFTDEEVKQILQDADVNGDNKISFEEFMHACT